MQAKGIAHFNTTLVVSVRTPCSILEGTLAWLPATMTTAIVSPIARPTPKITEARMPDLAAGTTVANTARSWVAQGRPLHSILSVPFG